MELVYERLEFFLDEISNDFFSLILCYIDSEKVICVFVFLMISFLFILSLKW